MPDVIVTIPGATNVTVDDAPATSVVVIFPASNYVVTTVIDRGILFGVEGPQGSTGGVNTINGQSGNVTLDTSEISENPSALYFTNTRVYTKVKAALVAGSNVSFTYNDTNQTITIAASGNVLSVNGQTGAVVLDTDDITEGSNEYFTAARVRAVVLTGLSTATNAIISATDSVLSAFGKIQAQITANLSTLTTHIADVSNPHAVTKSQVGLGNVDNTSDANKPISTATQTALNGKENTITAGTTAQYYRGDKTFQTLDKTAVGLSNVANVDTTNASNISSGTLNDSRLSANVTLQGNTFNAASKLVQLDANSKLPAVDGSNLTNLNIPPSTGGDLYLFYNY
jgi:hypothetical protein